MFKYTPRHILFPEPEPTEILKAYRLKHGRASGRDGDAWSEWYPEEAIRTHESDHPWYHQFEGDVPAHHPPFGFDHDSKELLWQNDYDSDNPHRDGKLAERPHTFHPMDYMIYDLAKYARKLLGLSQDQAEEIVKQKVMTPIIDAFNAKHVNVHGEDATHLLPGVNSVEWRRNTVGTFDKDSGGAMRMTRGSGTSDDGVQNPLINYALNKGNVLSEHSDQGNFIDSGVNHLHEEFSVSDDDDERKNHPLYKYFSEIANIALNPDYGININDPAFKETFEQMIEFIGDTFGGKGTYLNSPVVSLENLTFHKVGHDRGRHERFEAGHERPITDFHSLQGLDFAPQAMFDTVGTKQGNLTAEMVKEKFAEHGIEVTDEEAYDLLRMPKTHFAFAESRKNSMPGNILNAIGNDLGIDMQSKEYQNILNSIHSRDGHKHSRHLLAIPRYLAQQLIAEGYPPEEVEEMIKQRFASHDYIHGRHTRSDELQALGRDKFGQLKEKMGIPDLPEGHLAFEPLGEEHMRRGYTTVVPEYAEAHIHDDTAHPNMTAAQARAGQQAEMPVPTPEPMAEAPPMDELPQGQMRLTDFQKAQVAEITEAMEHIQLEDAKRDASILKMLPHNPIQLNSVQSVGLFAKDLGITSMDVHGLLHSRGDWHRIAKEWNVSPQVVKVVKVTFNGGV